MEGSRSGQAGSVLQGEPQRVRLGAQHHPSRALNLQHTQPTDGESKVKELIFHQKGFFNLSSSLFEGFERLWL